MTPKELERYMTVSRDREVCVATDCAALYPGIVREVFVGRMNEVRIEFNAYGTDEGGTEYCGEYASLGLLLADLEGYLGVPLERWQNQSFVGYPPRLESWGDRTPFVAFAVAVLLGRVELPTSVAYTLATTALGEPPWRTVAPMDAAAIACPRCTALCTTSVPFMDHHPRVCTSCGVESFLFTMSEFHLWVATASAPPVVQRFTRWAQAELDELEFVELIVELEAVL